VPSAHLYTVLGLCASSLSFCLDITDGMSSYVVISTWSENPCNVFGSYWIGYVALFVIIRSMHDLSVPLAKVNLAG
jgi:hypothetical protein